MSTTTPRLEDLKRQLTRAWSDLDRLNDKVSTGYAERHDNGVMAWGDLLDDIAALRDLRKHSATLNEQIRAERAHIDRAQTMNDDTNPNSATKPILDAVSARIFAAVCEAMQDAEEIGGPDGADYVDLMQAIAAEARERSNNATSAADE